MDVELSSLVREMARGSRDVRHWILRGRQQMREGDERVLEKWEEEIGGGKKGLGFENGKKGGPGISKGIRVFF